jgi:hypothetical protein
MDGPLKVTYYGHVFDASGYGEAARAYIHALHGAGVSLSVVDLLRHGRQVRDELVESLLGRAHEPDFHLFHGIPPQWARLAFPLSNAIGMTVWETDTMPSQWHGILNHVVDLWLPCAFNVHTFGQGLGREAFRLPHPVISRHVNGERSQIDHLAGGGGEFVFYSIFEWQDRKGPCELLRAYFDAFPRGDDTLLLLKINPAAAHAAAATVEQVRRDTGSTARVRVVADAWTPAHIEALHARGNCYVSLHRGEGWGYPLFDAAARGVPTIATAFSGPMDYLAGDGSHLVPYDLVPVEQRYVYYGPHMKWARPNVPAAAAAMRDVHANRAEWRARAAALGERIRASYSTAAVGRMAAARLRELADARERTRAHRVAPPAGPLTPPVPIPADWYDENYFERAVKSNWTGGYSWPLYAGVFRDTAKFLLDVFPDSRSFLDAGCAKGFLVRALREAGKECWGIEQSPWAVAHADPAARPFIIEGAVEDAAVDREIDVLVTLDVLSELTEEQIGRFLRRAREWTRTAILAGIPSFEADEPERPRAWWHERFLDAGWRQDALQRLGAQRLAEHPHPKKMRWHLYAYAAR